MAKQVTYGQYLMNQALPSDFQIGTTMSKGDIQKLLQPLAKDHPEEYVKVISELKRIGDEVATLEGITVGMDDISPDRALRDPIIKRTMAKIKDSTDDKMRRKEVLKAAKELRDTVSYHPGSMRLIAESGGRGSINQLMKIVTGPGAVQDSSGNIQPWLITRGFGEGLSFADYFAYNQESRSNIVSGRTQVSEPGDMSKIFTSVTSNQVITEKDCGTNNGLSMGGNDPEIIDRYLARSVPGFPKNTLVTNQVFNALAKKKDAVLVRSPMTCETKTGMCQLCVGLDVMGRPYGMGENTGVRSAQAISEPLTQFVLNARHGVRSVASPTAGFKGLKQLLDMPSQFINRATLSKEDGKVTDVESAPQGGKFVFVNKERHYIPPNLRSYVRKGDKVEQGDMLSEGIPHPGELVKYKGIGEGRKFLAKALHDIYSDQGIPVDKRHIESLVKSQIGHVQILNDFPKHNIAAGDIVEYNSFLRVMREDAEEVSLAQARDKLLADNYGHLTAGTKITPSVSRTLAQLGFKTVKIQDKPPRFNNIVKPITRNPLLDPDWMARLGFKYLKNTILEGATFGQSSDLHGTHPIPAFAYGVDFGKGYNGRY